MQFYIDISNSAGARLGSGPITSASRWSSTKRVDRIGSFEFAMPASDEKAALIASRRYATCYAILDTGPAEVGSGVIDRIETRPDRRPQMADQPHPPCGDFGGQFSQSRQFVCLRHRQHVCLNIYSKFQTITS